MDSTPPSPPPASTAEAVQIALVDRAAALVREQEGVRESDPGAVHRMRVASRRTRAALRLAEPFLGVATVARLIRDGRQVTRALGRLREEQVSLGILEQISRRADKEMEEVERAGFDFLLHRLERRVSKHFKRACRRLARVDLKRLEKRLKEAAGRPPIAAGGGGDRVDLILPIARIAEEHLQASREHPSDENLHRLRIGVKRLRYAIEVLGAGLEPAAPMVRALKELQGSLGEYHDLAVLAESVAAERAKLVEERRHALAGALAAALRRVAIAKRDALVPLGRRLERWPAGALGRRAARAVRVPRRRAAVAPLETARPAGVESIAEGEPGPEGV